MYRDMAQVKVEYPLLESQLIKEKSSLFMVLELIPGSTNAPISFTFNACIDP